MIISFSKLVLFREAIKLNNIKMLCWAILLIYISDLHGDGICWKLSVLPRIAASAGHDKKKVRVKQYHNIPMEV
jgi:hypothetical protein